MKSGTTTSTLAMITQTSRSTLINWIALGRVNPPKTIYAGIQSARYSDDELKIAIQQISKCKPLEITPQIKLHYTLKCNAYMIDHNKKEEPNGR